MTEQMEGQITFADLDSWFGKMSQEPSAATVEKTSKQSSQKSSKSQNRTFRVSLCLAGGGSGIKSDVSTMRWVDGQLLGEFTMHSFGESPREENVSRLSQILEDSAPQKYCLSERACAGILNRAAKRGKQLPEILKQALENQVRGDHSNT